PGLAFDQGLGLGSRGCRYHLHAPFLVLLSRASSHRRNPPKNAFELSPVRQPAGRTFSFLTFPPPNTTSSGSRAAMRRATTSAPARRHFFFPSHSYPRTPT